MNWIKTSKELPNFNFEVLTCDKHGLVATNFRRINEHGYDYWGDWDDNEQNNIEYWMPLPLPPRRIFTINS